ncbi:MAG TPA: ASCH domain-containing protein [Paracoccaceae bacterium]|nr:ASCH domain-containing protein [Paracoccaceae bacterium]HMO72720.1 ASCH domain-containing protein [Paracoccaceae bacterium]
MTPEQAAFWAAFKASGAAPPDADARFHSAFGIGGGSDEGAAMVIAGAKTATSALPAEFGDQPPPKPGDLSILLGAGGVPRAVVETVSMKPQSLDDMPPDFIAAYAEWPDAAAFRAGMTEWYRALDPGFTAVTPLLCERFRVVWVP